MINLSKLRLGVIERLLYLGFALILLVVGGLVAAIVIIHSNASKQTKLANSAIDKLNSQALQIKQLGEDNKKLNEQTRNYAHCTLVALSDYTQHNRPITVEDFDKCVLSFGNTSGATASASPTSSPSSSDKALSSSPPSQSSQNRPIPQPNISPMPLLPNPPSLIQQVMDTLRDTTGGILKLIGL